MQPIPEKISETAEDIGLRAGEKETTDLKPTVNGEKPLEFFFADSRFFTHYPGQILAFDLKTRTTYRPVEISRDQLKTFTGETIKFRQAAGSRDMVVLQAAAADDDLFFLVGHRPDPLTPALRIENDHLFSLDLNTGRLKKLDEIFGQDFEISDLVADRSAVYLTFPHKGKIERYGRDKESRGAALWRNRLSRLQKPVSLSVLNDNGLIVLDGSIPDATERDSSLLITFDLTTGQETGVSKFRLSGPLRVQLISNRIAIVKHANGLSAVDTATGRLQALVTSAVSGFYFDAASSSLYYLPVSKPGLLKKKLKIDSQLLATSHQQ